MPFLFESAYKLKRYFFYPLQKKITTHLQTQITCIGDVNRLKMKILNFLPPSLGFSHSEVPLPINLSHIYKHKTLFILTVFHIPLFLRKTSYFFLLIIICNLWRQIFLDLCRGCGEDLQGGSHTCSICKHKTHPFCGVSGEEEGYGKAVTCKQCINGNDIYLIHVNQ